MIAITESTRMFHDGSVAYWLNTGMVDYEEWITALDDAVCEICEPLHGVQAPLGEPFIDAAGNEYVPPAHVYCRCGTSPVIVDI